MKISILIPNYNGAHLLKKNLPYVQKAGRYYQQKTGNTFEIIVSDDASTDTSRDVVAKLDFPITYLEHEKNVGFSSNVNRGVQHVNGEIMVLLNSDVRPNEAFLVPLLRHFENETVFAVGCHDISIENSKEVSRGRGIGHWERGFLLHGKGDVSQKNTLWVSGGSGAFRKKTWDILGGLYPIYNPFYWEDIDLSYRSLKAGYTILFEPESQVIHEHEDGSIKKQFTKSTITSVSYRNQILFVWLNITDLRLMLSHLLWLPIHLISAVIRGDRIFLQGCSSAFSFFSEAMMLRKKNKRFSQVTDDTIIRGVQA